MQRGPSDEYLEKAKKLPREEVEQLLSRMQRKMMRRMEDRELTPLEAAALQLQKEDADLEEWRSQWTKIVEQDENRKNGK